MNGAKRSSRASIRAPIRRSGSAIRSTGRRRIDSSPSSVQLPPGWPASQPGSSRISVPALPTSIAPAAGAAARSPVPRIVRWSSPALDQRAERLDRGERGVRVGGVEVAGDAHRVDRHRRQQRRAVRERLVRGRAHACRAAGPDGSNRRFIVATSAERRSSAIRTKSTRGADLARAALERRRMGEHGRAQQPSTASLAASPRGSRPAGCVDRGEPLQAQRPLRAESPRRRRARRAGPRARPRARRARRARVAVGGEDLRPQRGVGARHAGHVAERGARRARPAARPRAASPASACGDHVRDVARARDGGVVLLGACRRRAGRRARRPPPTSASSGSSESPAGQTAHGARRPRAARRPTRRAQPDGLGAGHRMRADAAAPAPRQPAPSRRRCRPRSASGSASSTSPARPRGAGRRHGDEHELAARAGRRASRATSKPSPAAASRTAGSAS